MNHCLRLVCPGPDIKHTFKSELNAKEILNTIREHCDRLNELRRLSQSIPPKPRRFPNRARRRPRFPLVDVVSVSSSESCCGTSSSPAAAAAARSASRFALIFLKMADRSVTSSWCARATFNNSVLVTPLAVGEVAGGWDEADDWARTF